MLNLTAEDRCDRCGAQAYHVASKKGFSDLLLCNHHYREFGEKLLADGWTITSDESPSEPTPVSVYSE